MALKSKESFQLEIFFSPYVTTAGNQLAFFSLSCLPPFFSLVAGVHALELQSIRSLARLCFISSNSIPVQQKSQQRKKKEWIEGKKNVKEKGNHQTRQTSRVHAIHISFPFLLLLIFFFSSFGTCVFIIKIYTRRTIFYRNGIFFVRAKERRE